MFIFLFRCVLSQQVRSSVVSSVKRDGLVVLLQGLAVSWFTFCRKFMISRCYVVVK